MIKQINYLRRPVRISVALAILLPAVLVGGGAAVRAETGFPQTGYSIWGPFETYWKAHGGLAQFGMPRTSVYSAGKDYDAQWFERALFTYNPSKPDPYKVELNLLGNEITASRGAEVPFVRSNPGSGATYFETTGHNLSGKFLSYWEETGGVPIYGYPISEPFMEGSKSDGKTYLVQYFERNRFELHPELAGTSNEVLLGLLGSELLDMHGGPEAVAAAPKAAYYPRPSGGVNVPPGGIVTSPNAGTPGPVNNNVPPAPSLPATSKQVLFSSDFSSSDLSAWTPTAPYTPPDALPASWQARNGLLEQSGDAQMDGTAEDALLLTNDPRFGDFTLDTYFYAGGGESAGVVVRYGKTGYYVLKVFSTAPNSEPKVRLDRVAATGGETTLASSQAWPGYKAGAWYRLTVTAKGSELTAQIDGVQLIKVVDTQITSGQVGLYAYADGRAKFDNFRLTTP